MITAYQWAGPKPPEASLDRVDDYTDAPSFCAAILRLFADEIAVGVTTGIPGYFGDVEATKETMFKAALPDGWWKELSSNQRPLIIATFRCPTRHPLTIYLCPSAGAFADLFQKVAACPAL